MKSNSAKSAPPGVGAADPGVGVVREICQIVSNMCGIQLGEKQFSMVESRLKSRMIRLGIATGEEYLAYLKANRDAETGQLLSLITTHHTYFFREFNHFEYLIREGLARVIAGVRRRGDQTIRVWSSACSRGQEVYTIAMFLDYHLKALAPDLTYKILGTDVDGEVVRFARNGVYHFQELKTIPAVYLGSNWSRGTGDIADYAKVKENLRDKCTFSIFNLVKPEQSPLAENFDLIFCRNVFIYFNDEQIRNSVNYQMSKLAPHGYFFVGISESLSHLSLPVEYIAPATYGKKIEGSPAPKAVEPKKIELVRAGVKAPPKPPTPVANDGPIMRVLCVDDSQSILTILKKVLGKEHGFEVVDTALNGKEAIEKLRTLKVDVVTLDIHMPEMDGLAYLKSAMRPGHPPVVMVSTVNRDNSDVAIKALELGASDYVEKPTLSNLEERSDEIRAKLRTAVLFKNQAVTSLDSQFKRSYKITDPDKKVHLVVGTTQFKRKVSYMLKNFQKDSPPLVFVTEGAGAALEKIAAEMSKETSSFVQVAPTDLKPGSVSLFDLSQHAEQIKSLLRGRKISSLVWGVQSQKSRKWIVSLGEQSLFLEDLAGDNEPSYGELTELARFTAPITSYYSVAEEYLK